jgi:hypothetical protein
MEHREKKGFHVVFVLCSWRGRKRNEAVTFSYPPKAENGGAAIAVNLQTAMTQSVALNREFKPGLGGSSRSEFYLASVQVGRGEGNT